MNPKQNLSSYIDHTNLKPETTSSEIKILCEQAVEYGFHSVCINPSWAPLAKNILSNTPVKVCTVIGFPLGSNLAQTKAAEARQLYDLGTDEYDMVMNIGAAREGEWSFVHDEIEEIVHTVRGNCVKVILETCLLTDEQIIAACHTCEKAGARFVKTSTGFNKEGATLHHVALMKRSISPTMGLKAAGGIRDKQTALAMIEAGATRIGASASITIVT